MSMLGHRQVLFQSNIFIELRVILSVLLVECDLHEWLALFAEHDICVVTNVLVSLANLRFASRESLCFHEEIEV